MSLLISKVSILKDRVHWPSSKRQVASNIKISPLKLSVVAKNIICSNGPERLDDGLRGLCELVGEQRKDLPLLSNLHGASRFMNRGRSVVYDPIISLILGTQTILSPYSNCQILVIYCILIYVDNTKHSKSPTKFKCFT